MEVLWKAIYSIINRRLSSSIQFHDAMCGFRVGIGTGTCILEENLLQRLIAMSNTVLHSVCLDLRKAYDALDRYRYIYILVGYGVGPKTLRILQTYWVWLHMAAKVGGTMGPYSIATTE